MSLKILACRQVYSGKNQRGDQYTIYEIDAANAQGQHINEKLRSFEALPIGQTIDVTVKVFNSERHGKSYTLHQKGRTGGGNTERVNELAEMVQELTERVATLTGRVNALEGMVAGRSAPADAKPGYTDEELEQKFGQDPGW